MAQKEQCQTLEKNLAAVRREHAPLQKKIDVEKNKKEAIFNNIKAQVTFPV